MCDKQKLMVVVPAFNEAMTIDNTINSLNSIKEELLQSNLELNIIIIDDGSTDNTADIVAKYQSVHLVSHQTNLGLGAAVRSGLIEARRHKADIAVKFDADCQHNPRDIKNLVLPIIENKADVVYGNRFERISYKMPLVRRVGNLVFIRLMRWLTRWDIKDSQPGIFAVNSKYLEVLYLPGDYNYTQQVLINAYNTGMRFEQVPVDFNERTTGKSFVSFKYPIKVLPQILRVLVGIKPLTVFGNIGIYSIFFASAVFVYGLYCYFLGYSEKPVEHSNLVLGMGLFGIQSLFLGLIADLIIQQNKQYERNTKR
ncbi:MAG: glycosyltransferase family 2 protein [Sedimentisphaeraceae bacterium JB056]